MDSGDVDNTDTPREVNPGVTFNFTAGQTLRVDLGRRRIYANRATFLDLIGIPQSPDIFVMYPILSLSSNSTDMSPELTILNYFPAFAAYNDELYEEYLEYTVLSGLSATGGLYSVFEVIFILIFGRSLLAAVRGSKHLAPFGAIASLIEKDSFLSKLKGGYPGIDAEDGNTRAIATYNLLNDFVLDLTPLKIPPTHREELLNSTGNLNVEKEEFNDGQDIERSQRTFEPSALTHTHHDVINGSA